MNDLSLKKRTLRSKLFLLGGYLFWPLLAFKLYLWLTEPVDTYKPVEFENDVLFTRTQPFHKTIQFRLVYHRQDGWLNNDDEFYDWAYKLKDGSWQQFYFDDGEYAGILIFTNYEPYADYIAEENRAYREGLKK